MTHSITAPTLIREEQLTPANKPGQLGKVFVSEASDLQLQGWPEKIDVLMKDGTMILLHRSGFFYVGEGEDQEVGGANYVRLGDYANKTLLTIFND